MRRIGLGSVHLDLELKGGKGAADGLRIAERYSTPAPPFSASKVPSTRLASVEVLRRPDA